MRKPQRPVLQKRFSVSESDSRKSSKNLETVWDSEWKWLSPRPYTHPWWHIFPCYLYSLSALLLLSYCKLLPVFLFFCLFFWKWFSRKMKEMGFDVYWGCCWIQSEWTLVLYPSESHWFSMSFRWLGCVKGVFFFGVCFYGNDFSDLKKWVLICTDRPIWTLSNT